MADVSVDCTAYESDLSALLDAELASEREVAVRAHLDSCGRCRQRLEDLCGVDLALAGSALPEVPGDLGARIERRIQLDRAPAEPPIARHRTAVARRRWPAPALAVAAALAVYLAVVPEREPAGPPVGDPIALVQRVPAREFEELSDEEIAVVLELETIQDYDVIANLELLERLVELEEGAG